MEPTRSGSGTRFSTFVNVNGHLLSDSFNGLVINDSSSSCSSSNSTSSTSVNTNDPTKRDYRTQVTRIPVGGGSVMKKMGGEKKRCLITEKGRGDTKEIQPRPEEKGANSGLLFLGGGGESERKKIIKYKF